ncbi:hypothetical protein [Paraburkholderia fungorum]|nr:hypothetical protein [Paraburkholderia fungorum]
MLLNKWKDGSAGHAKAMAAAFVNAIVYAGILGAVALIGLHLSK